MLTSRLMTSLLTHFGSELRRYRDRAGLTQEQLGAAVGYTGALGRLWPLVRRYATRSRLTTPAMGTQFLVTEFADGTGLVHIDLRHRSA